MLPKTIPVHSDFVLILPYTLLFVDYKEYFSGFGKISSIDHDTTFDLRVSIIDQAVMDI